MEVMGSMAQRLGPSLSLDNGITYRAFCFIFDLFGCK